MIDQTISHYKVTGKLGEGGMGVVYKAEDTNLKRPVALKFLAAHLLGDKEIKARFRREAEAAAALNHPNVCHVYEISEVEGKTFIAMAFLEGEPLEKKIEAGPLKLKDALDIAIQTARGLEAAHEKKIVHRDIKPANLMITGAGSKRLVTIMDFGLALLADRSKLTRLDETMGTVTYMSPEQTYGMELDQRTDVWSLGVVIYEMVTGQRPFKGHYDKAVMYSITNEEPEPMTALRTGVPMELEWLVNKCLAKEADKRYQSTADMVVDLEMLSEKLKSGKSTILRAGAPVGTGTLAGPSAGPSGAGTRAVPPAETGTPAGPSHAADAEVSHVRERNVAPPVHLRPAPTRERVAWAATTVLALAAITLALVHFTEPVPQIETSRFLIHEPEGVWFGRRAAEISPDGRHLAFVGGSSDGVERLWIRSLDSLQARPLVGTEGAFRPFWSPDSRFLGFFADGKLKKISTFGGPPQTLCDAPLGLGGTWARGSTEGEGVIVFAPRMLRTLYRVSDAGGEPIPVTVLDESTREITHWRPHFLPDGQHFLYVGGRAPGDARVYVGSLDAGANGQSDSREKSPLLPDDTAVRYAPPTRWYPGGYLLFVRENSLMAQEFDAGRLEPAGQPFPIAEGVQGGSGLGAGDFSVSRTGVLAYRTGAGGGLTQLQWFDREGKQLTSVGEPGVYFTFSVSPDETRAAVSRADSGDIWVFDLSRGVSSRFTFDPVSELTHTWSPDGERLVFSSTRDGAYNLYLKPASGAGEAELLLQTDNNKGPRDWSRDGRLILYQEQDPETGWDLWVLPLEGERKPSRYLQTGFNEQLGQFSPDGRWVAYNSDESGRTEVYVQPFPASGDKHQVSIDGGIEPRWRPDGKELFYLTADGRMMVAEIFRGETFRAGVPQMLFRAPGVNPVLASTVFHYDVSKDGQRFLIDAAVEGPTQSPVTIVLNWQAALRP